MKSKEEKRLCSTDLEVQAVGSFHLAKSECRIVGRGRKLPVKPYQDLSTYPPILSDSHVGHEMDLKKKKIFFGFSKPLLFPFSHSHWADRAAAIEPSAKYDLMILDALYPKTMNDY